jgi:oxygen-dependent protoporphyrinogen oxidase
VISAQTGPRVAGRRVAIVGGGIAGLAAAFFLRDRGITVTVLEGSPRLGGKLDVSDVAGIPVDAGAEALLARRPEGVDLIRAIGLGDQLTYPGATTAGIWTRGRFCSLPKLQVMGVPADMDDLERSGIVSPAGLERARQDEAMPATARDGDVAVGAFVGARLGREVVDRLVDPLLGGVYAGRADALSFEATIPGLAQESRQHRSLAEAAAAVLGGVPGRSRASGAASGSDGQQAQPGPVFTTLARGLGSLPGKLAEASGAIVRTKATVREIARTPDGWQLTVGPAVAPELVGADAVILALPARPASRLVSLVPGAAPAAGALAEIDYASMAIITLAYPVTAFPEAITGSGYLVPAVDERAVKAVTYSTVKWPHLVRARGGGLHLVRCSVGRTGEEALLQRDDEDLAALAAADLAAATGVTGKPEAARVTRWGGGLPQYTVGHLDRVRRIREGIAGLPGLAVCGAAFDGIGIPACIASAQLAASQVIGYLDRAVTRGVAQPARGAGE